MRGRRPSAIVTGSSPVTTLPKPPAFLSKDAKAEWRRIAPIMIEDRKTLTVADLATLANFCIAIGTVAESSRTVAREGMTFMTATGPKKHPAVAIRNDAMTQARLLAGELGLTPVARSRAAVREEADEGADDLGLE